MSTLINDIKYGVRVLKTNPAFTIVAVLTLALAIGANTAIFTMINAMLLKSLPGVEDPQQLVLVTDKGWWNLSYPLYEHLRDGDQSCVELFACPGVDKRKMQVAETDATEPESVWAQAVSGSFFSVLDVPAALGRTLTPNDNRPGDPQPVAMISYDFWCRRFGQDPAVIGQTVSLEDVPLSIVGVAPRGFHGFVVGGRPDIWWPIQWIEQVQGWDGILASGGSQWLQIAGRLKPGVTALQAQNALDVIFQRMRLAQLGDRQLSDKERRDFLSHRIQLHAAGAGFTRLRRDFQQLLWILMAIVGLVLLVACTNLAGLLLARGAVRQREFSVRAALGAGRLVLVRQLVTENLLLAVMGGVLGLLLAQWGVNLLARYIPNYGTAVHLQLTPDLKILGFTCLVSIGTGILFGLFPAWYNSRLDVVTSLKDQAGMLPGNRRGSFWSKALSIAQVAMSCCLLIGAGLFVRTVHKLQTLDVGFERENLLTFQLEPEKGYDHNREATLYEEVLTRLQNLPPVQSASLSNVQALGGSEIGWGPPKVAVLESGETPHEPIDVRGTGVGLDYFQTMGIPFLLGRDFGPQDLPSLKTDQASQSPRPVIIDLTSARKLFGDKNPLGMLLQPIGRSSWPPLEIIGVVGDVVHKGLRGGTRISIYGLETYRARALKFFCVRTHGYTRAVASSIRHLVHELDPEVEVTSLHTMEEMVNKQTRRERMLSQLAGFFSLSALALACLGLYGILSHAVARRTREIGIRMALGAQRYNVLSAIIRQGMFLTLVGCTLGILLAIGLTRIISSLLFGVTPTDPLTFFLTVLVLGSVALVACWLPARKAAKINPMEALRYE